MVTVYALLNQFNEEVYVGMSTAIKRRLREHNTGKNRYTKAFKPWEIFYTEEHGDWESARKREKYLKSAAGKRFLKSLDAFHSGNRGSLPD
jgi:predicted GIY-YIG superfamily endonuclease